jgi:hypothetical protein
MASRRTMFTRDRQRNSTARKIKDKEIRARAKQQAGVLRTLVAAAKAEAKTAT